MELWTHVRQKNNLLRTLTMTSIIFGFIIFTICVELASEHYGFGQGYSMAKDYYDNHPKIPFDIVVLGQPRYEFLTGIYNSVALLIVVFLIGKILEIIPVYKTRGAKSVSHVISLILVGGSLLTFNQIFSAKYRFLEEWLSSDPYDAVLRKSITYDWLCFILLAILLLIQIAVIVINFIKSPEKVEKP